MFFSQRYARVLLLGVFMVVAGFFFSYDAGAFSGIQIDSGSVRFIDIDATVMAVNLEKGYLIVAERRFDIQAYQLDGEIYKTRLLDEHDNEVFLKKFKEGQRVVVEGIQISKQNIIAETIRIKKAEKDTSGYRFVPKARVIKRLRP